MDFGRKLILQIYQMNRLWSFSSKRYLIIRLEEYSKIIY